MKRFFVTVALCTAMVIGAVSCKKSGGEVLPAATEKGQIRIEKFEGIERGKGLSGDLLLSVSNGLRSNISLTRGEMAVNIGGSTCCTFVLTDEVELPKRVVSSVRVPVSLTLTSPVVSYALLQKLMRGELNKISVTLDAEAKMGGVRRRIYRENIPLRDALQMMGVSADALKSLVK